ncbi:hypothetical protein [Aestuariivirga sp.]|uniref:hypothetical protein n=1 Tax=Aestuariivirga sp. TaxID=2650926 RepID=UPI0039E6D590
MARLLTALVSAAVLSTAIAAPALSDTSQPKYTKLKSTSVLKKKAGYWTECSYSAVGENCYTVYMRPRTPEGGVKGFAPLKANSKTVLKKKQGYYVECSYSGLGENCYYVYATTKKPK